MASEPSDKIAPPGEPSEARTPPLGGTQPAPQPAPPTPSGTATPGPTAKPLGLGRPVPTPHPSDFRFDTRVRNPDGESGGGSDDAGE